MTREEQINFCKKCTNRKFEDNLGLICSLNGQIATFDQKCENFVLDENYSETNIHKNRGLSKEDLAKKLPVEIYENLLFKQNLPQGIIISLIVGFIGAFIWGKITVATQFQIGLMPIVIGATVGLSMRYFGKGIETKFGLWGSGIAVFSCLLGNFFSVLGFIGDNEGLSFFETLIRFDYSLLPTVMVESFSIVDLVFYVIALIEGYKFSIRFITEKDIIILKQKGI